MHFAPFSIPLRPPSDSSQPTQWHLRLWGSNVYDRRQIGRRAWADEHQYLRWPIARNDLRLFIGSWWFCNRWLLVMWLEFASMSRSNTWSEVQTREGHFVAADTSIKTWREIPPRNTPQIPLCLRARNANHGSRCLPVPIRNLLCHHPLIVAFPVIRSRRIAVIQNALRTYFHLSSKGTGCFLISQGPNNQFLEARVRFLPRVVSAPSMALFKALLPARLLLLLVGRERRS